MHFGMWVMNKFSVTRKTGSSSPQSYLSLW
jgi:hypothetical protein